MGLNFLPRIITQQICEVEVQTIVLEQFSSGMFAFSKDVQRQTTRQVGFDESISSKISQITNEDGSINASDFGFSGLYRYSLLCGLYVLTLTSGSDVGNSTVVPQGSNWNDATSPASVQAALDAAKAAGGSV